MHTSTNSEVLYILRMSCAVLYFQGWNYHKQCMAYNMHLALLGLNTTLYNNVGNVPLWYLQYFILCYADGNQSISLHMNAY